MKKLLLIFSLFGLVSFANAEAIMEIFPPPVKETPALTKKFNKQYWDMSVATDKMGLNINGVKTKELDFFNDKFKSYVKACQKYQPEIEKGLYNERSLKSFFTCGSSLMATARDYKILINQRTREMSPFRYEELMSRIEKMEAYGGYLHNMSLRSLKKYYNVDL